MSLVFENEIIKSKTGVQQGDPLGLLLFALTIDDVVRLIDLWYLDDAIIGGSFKETYNSLRKALPALKHLGLDINVNKSELINVSYPYTDFFSIKESFNELLPGIPTVPVDKLYFL